jgi:hypothetical protein
VDLRFRHAAQRARDAVGEQEWIRTYLAVHAFEGAIRRQDQQCAIRCQGRAGGPVELPKVRMGRILGAVPIVRRRPSGQQVRVDG